MADKKDFKKAIKVDTKINQYTPNFDDMESKEHSLWIQEEVNNTRQQQLYRLEILLQHIHQFYRENSGPAQPQLYGFGRIKSPYSMEQNIRNNKNLLDAMGVTFVVNKVSPDFPAEVYLAEAIDLISINPYSPEVSALKHELESVLNLVKTNKDNGVLKGEDDFFNTSLFGHKHKFKNMEVLLVHAINQFISRAKKINTYDFSNKQEVFERLRVARSATNYGSSIDMYNQFVGYAKTDANYQIIQRYKPVSKPNGYVAYHLGVYDSLTKLPIEIKFMTVENLYLAENGSASHQDIEGKSRNFLDPLELHSSIPQNQIAELINFFSEENLNKMLSPIPNYIFVENSGQTKIHTPWENFQEYYERQLKTMPIEMKDLYSIGLQLLPEFNGSLPPYFTSKENKDKYPYNLLPIINKISNLNKQH